MGTVTPAIWFPLKAMVIVWGIVIAVFNTTVLKTGSGVEKLLITAWATHFNVVNIFLDISKNFIADMITLQFTYNGNRGESNPQQQNKKDDWRQENND